MHILYLLLCQFLSLTMILQDPFGSAGVYINPQASIFNWCLNNWFSHVRVWLWVFDILILNNGKAFHLIRSGMWQLFIFYGTEYSTGTTAVSLVKCHCQICLGLTLIMYMTIVCFDVWVNQVGKSYCLIVGETNCTKIGTHFVPGSNQLHHPGESK